MTVQINLEIIRADSTPPPAPKPKKYIGWRCLHVVEGGRDIPTDVLSHPPAVVPDYTGKFTPMTRDIQLMSFNLQRHFCDAVTKERWRNPLHQHDFAMTNKGAGFDYPDRVLRDYVNGKDLNAIDNNGKPALPKYDKIRVFQGSFITGVLDGNLIWCQPGVDGIDANGFTYTPETLQKIIDEHKYSIGVAVGNPPFHIREQWGAGCVIAFPFIFSQPIAYEAKFFERWEEDFLPDPITIYKKI